MPSVAIYIREDDYEQWKAIEKKSEFIHDALIMAKLPSEVLKTRTVPQIKINGTLGKLTVKQPDPKPPAAIRDVVNETIREGEAMLRDTAKIIKTPQDAKKAVEKFAGPITKQYSSRKQGSKERHVEL